MDDNKEELHYCIYGIYGRRRSAGVGAPEDRAQHTDINKDERSEGIENGIQF